RGALVRERALADRVHRRHLVEVGDPVGQDRVGEAADVPERGQERFGAGGGGAVDLVADDRRAAVGAGRRPGQADGGVAGGGAGQVGRAGDGRGRGRGRASLGRERALADRVHRADLVEVGRAGGQPRVGEARDVAERGEQDLGAAARGAVHLVVGDRR